MALNDGLARFRLQQERNQATKTSSSSSSTKPSHSQQQPAPTPTPTPRPAAKPSPPVPAARLSDDAAPRLKETNTASKLAAGPRTQIRFSDDTARLINEWTYVDIDSNNAVAEMLRSNPKVRFDGKRYSYKRTHHVKGKDELLSLVTSFPYGLLASEVEDAYPSALEDPNDPRVRMEVDAELKLKKMFRDIKLPQDMLDIEKELQKNDEKPATDTAKRRATEQIHGQQPEPEKARKKPRGITSRTKLTNVHLPGLFDLPVKSKPASELGSVNVRLETINFDDTAKGHQHHVNKFPIFAHQDRTVGPCWMWSVGPRSTLMDSVTSCTM